MTPAVATLAPPADPLIGQTVSRYHVVERLDSGGMGVVYKAVDTSLGRTVALKFLQSDLGADAVAHQRFAQEARAASALDHPNICTIFEIGQTQSGTPFIAMAFYEGRTLEVMLREGALPVASAANLVLQVAEALGRAHDAGIVHRDVKPANVMVTERGLVKLLDFGIAKLAGDVSTDTAVGAEPDRAPAGVTRVGTIVGTPAYMSPEQLGGATVDQRTDIWSLGVLLYELLTGQLPFPVTQPRALLYAMVSGSYTPIRTLRPELPEALAAVVHTCLAMQPHDRFAHADEVAAALRPFAPGRETLAAQLWPEGSRPPLPSVAQVAAAPSTLERNHELILLRKVRQFWIEGVLEKSIHQAMLLEVGKETRPEALAHPWEQVLELPDQQSRTLPPQQRTSDLYLGGARSLLILGSPGAGKTITLLELVRDLVGIAEEDASQPVPIVLNLSSWTNPKQSLADWIARELSAKYQIPRRIGRTWVERGRLALMLDGLDEVQSVNREACVAAINAHLSEHGAPGIAVCCRAEDYTVLQNRLQLAAAIALRPLSPGQVQEHVTRAGPPLAGLAAALQDNAVLLAMARSPLMLDVMSMAYWDVPAHTLREQSRENGPAQRDRLFATYVERMFQRRGREGAWDKADTLRMLSTLARRMQQHGQSMFLIEQLQPSWLQRGVQRWTYALLTRIVGGILVGSFFGFVSGVVVALMERYGTRPDGSLVLGPILKLYFGTGPMLDAVQAPLSGLAFGAGAGAVLALLGGRRLNTEATSSRSEPPRFPTILLRASLTAVALAIVGGAAVSVVWGPLEGLEVGLFFSILFATLWATRDHTLNPQEDIHPVEAITWSPRKARLGLLTGLLLGLGVGQAFGVLFAIVSHLPVRAAEILQVGVIWGISFAAIVGFFGGLVADVVESKTVLNQGLALSRRNALRIGLIFAAVAGLCQGLMAWVFEGVLSASYIGILIGGIFGFAAGVWFGGLDVFHHYVLRAQLCVTDRLPYRWPRFLRHAQQLVFVQRVGGGVVFTHRLLLEYFAGLPQASADTRSGA